ncbi:hypothetical protein Pan54_47540 [Rubinisphaera italica]|uniref:Uncharacterized protein n=1 Tax=Rubinisphaera italica TaxID=2527969 RepID=A0A5C5XM76_9PLAN|nr:hypothetical protein Pan54_47540 [Rubinisphaera italica]
MLGILSRTITRSLHCETFHSMFFQSIFTAGIDSGLCLIPSRINSPDGIPPCMLKGYSYFISVQETSHVNGR